MSRRNQEEFTDILAARLDALELHLTAVGADVAALRAALVSETDSAPVDTRQTDGAMLLDVRLHVDRALPEPSHGQ